MHACAPTVREALDRVFALRLLGGVALLAPLVVAPDRLLLLLAMHLCHHVPGQARGEEQESAGKTRLGDQLNVMGRSDSAARAHFPAPA